MYGEVDFTDKSKKITITKENKIELPDFTKVQSAESVLIMYDLKMKKLIICNEEDNQTLLKKYEENLKKLLLSKKIDHKTFRKYQRIIYAKLTINSCKVDSKKRIKLPQKVVEQLEFTGTVFAIGTKTFLEIYKDEKTYHSFKKI